MPQITSKEDLYLFEKQIGDIKVKFNPEYYIDSLLKDYIYGYHQIPEVTKKEIYWFAMDTACGMVRNGAIFSKWFIAQELIKKYGFMRQNPLNDILAKLLIEMAAHENQWDACNYMARLYNEFKFNKQDIGNYWLNKNSDYGFERIGNSLPLYVGVLDDNQKFIYLKSKS